MFNIDEIGVSFKKLSEGLAFLAVGSSKTTTFSTGALFKGKIDHLTLMPVVNAAGDTFSPVVIVPGVFVPFKKVNGAPVTLNDCFMEDTSFICTMGRLVSIRTFSTTGRFDLSWKRLTCARKLVAPSRNERHGNQKETRANRRVTRCNRAAAMLLLGASA